MRNSESINAKLDKTLRQAENDHQKLVAELKAKAEDARLNEVQQMTMEIKSIDNKNQRTNEDNKQLAITVPIPSLS